MARLSSMYPRGPYDVSKWLQVLPADGSVPHMPGWRGFMCRVTHRGRWRSGAKVIAS
jgi:hypothetical protein